MVIFDPRDKFVGSLVIHPHPEETVSSEEFEVIGREDDGRYALRSASLGIEVLTVEGDWKMKTPMSMR